MSIISHWLSSTNERCSRENQVGFRSSRICIDEIFVLRQIVNRKRLMDPWSLFSLIRNQRLTKSIVQFFGAAFYWSVWKRNSFHFLILFKLLNSSSCQWGYFIWAPTVNDAHQKCPISHLHFTFKIAPSPCEKSGIDICSGRKLSDLEYADNVILQSEDPSKLQIFSQSSERVWSSMEFVFAPSSTRVLVQEWPKTKQNLIPAEEQRGKVDGFSFLDRCISPSASISDVYSHTQNARLIFINFRHLWRQHDIRLLIKARVYTVLVRSLLLYGSETWPLADFWRPGVGTPLSLL